MEVSETSSPLDYRLLSKVMKANLCHLGSHMTQVRTHLYVYYIKLVWTVEQDLIATVYQRENSYEKWLLLLEFAVEIILGYLIRELSSHL